MSSLLVPVFTKFLILCFSVWTLLFNLKQLKYYSIFKVFNSSNSKKVFVKSLCQITEMVSNFAFVEIVFGFLFSTSSWLFTINQDSRWTQVLHQVLLSHPRLLPTLVLGQHLQKPGKIRNFSRVPRTKVLMGATLLARLCWLCEKQPNKKSLRIQEMKTFIYQICAPTML